MAVGLTMMLTVAAPLLHNSVPAQLVAVIVVLAPDTILLALGVNVGADGIALTTKLAEAVAVAVQVPFFTLTT